MNRRNFLKRAFAVVAIPSVLTAAPKVEAIKVPWVRMSAHYSYDKAELKRACNTVSGGVTQEQLADLIRCTLKDLPKGFMESAWTCTDYSITTIYKGIS